VSPVSPYRSPAFAPSVDVLSPAERWLVVQAAAVIGFSSWAGGGSYPWGPAWILALSSLAVPIVLLRAAEKHRVHWLAFLPAAGWLGFCAIAALNPSYTPLPTGGWMPRPDWIEWLPGTVDRARTLAAAQSWLAALIEAGALVAVSLPTRAVRWLWGFAALNGFVLAAVGAFFRFSDAELMLGFIVPPEPTYFFATFFYKNHWAAFGTLSAAATLALVPYHWPRAQAGDPRASGRVLWFAGAGLLTLITLPLPGSRAGALLAAAVAISFGALLWRTGRSSANRPGPRGRSLGLGVLVLAVLAFGVIAYLPRAEIDLTRTRQQLTRSAEARPDLRLLLSRDTWHMARARPWFGWGPGSFAIVFPQFQGAYLRDAEDRPQARIEDAHDDWLQWLAECGWIGSAIVIIPAGWFACRAAKMASAVGRWTLAVCLLVALYAWVDFPFRNPAVLMLWTILFSTAGRL
jgi:O-antigen ligase